MTCFQKCFFCSGVWFCLLLIPYLCFISFLYIDLCVLEDGALGSFMQTKHLCALFHIWTKGGLVPWTQFGSCGGMFLLTNPGRCFFCGSFVLFLLCVYYAFMCICLFLPCGHLLGGAGLLALVCDVLLWVCYFPIGVLGQVWSWIVSIPDLWPLSYLV